MGRHKNWNERERRVLREMIIEGYTLANIACRFGVSKDPACRVVKKFRYDKLRPENFRDLRFEKQ